MDYSRYLNFNDIYINGKEAIQAEDFPSKNPIAYFINKLGKITDNVDNVLGMVKCGGKEPNNDEYIMDLIDINDEILDEFLYKINFFSDKLFDDYNQIFRNVTDYDEDMWINPFEIYEEEMDDFLKGMYENTEQSNIEIQLKSMQLFNRCAHIMDEFQKHIITRNIRYVFSKKYENENIHKKYTEDSRFRWEYDSTLKKTEKLYNNLYESCRKPDMLKNKFIELYEKFLNKEITLEEINNSDVLKDIKEKKENIDGNDTVKLKYQDIYLFFRTNDIKEKMFESKNTSLLLAVKEYTSLEDKKEKNKYRITKSKDRSKVKDKLDKYSNVINFYIAGYNCQYSVHIPEGNIQEIEEEMNKINEKIEETGSDISYSLQYKYSEKQKEEIISFKNLLDRYSGRINDKYVTLCKIVNNIYDNIIWEKKENEIDIR